MADDEQQPPAQRYWTSPPQPLPPAPRPALRPQLSRRDSRLAPPPSRPVAPSPSWRSPRPQAATAGASRGAAAGAAAPQAQPQPTRLPRRPSPSRAAPVAPIREPNASAAPASIATEPKPPLKPASPPPHSTAHEVPKQKDIIIIPQEKIIHEPPADSKPHSKTVEKEKDKEKKDKEKEKKQKEKEKEEHKEEKEKEHKEKKEKEKEEIKSKEPGSRHDMHGESKPKEMVEESANKKISSHGGVEHGGKLHKELKAGVADMVHKLGASAPSSSHERPAAAGATVITLAGENKGASMKISRAEADGKADAAGKVRRGHKLDAAERKEAAGAKGLTVYVNSNAQVINNSLMLQSSCSGGDPGVHLKLSSKSKKGDGEKAGGKSGSVAAVPKK